jgi:hypothetical protein
LDLLKLESLEFKLEREREREIQNKIKFIVSDLTVTINKYLIKMVNMPSTSALSTAQENNIKIKMENTTEDSKDDFSDPSSSLTSISTSASASASASMPPRPPHREVARAVQNLGNTW